MLRRTALTAALAVAATCLSGCGTALNLLDDTEIGGKRVYGGAQDDWRECRALASGDQSNSRYILAAKNITSIQESLERAEEAVESPCVPAVYAAEPTLALQYALDMPLSVIADTLALPYTVPCALCRWTERRRRTAPGEVGSSPTPDQPSIR